VNQLVDVKHRPRVGKDKEGGRARIVKAYLDTSAYDPTKTTYYYDVRFVVFSKQEKRIEEIDILAFDEVQDAVRSRNILGRCK
jgi:hypothetical protein